MTAAEPLVYRSAALSHQGTVRKFNEDAFISRDDIGLWAVADGVGGHDAGDVASRMTVSALAAIGQPAAGKAYLDQVRTQILQANTDIIAYGRDTPDIRSLGATIVCLITFRNHFACLWAGDSRAYRFRDGALTQLTRDHSWVQDLIALGEIDAEEARDHPQRNVITRALGFQPDLALDEARGAIAPGDRFLLCSDGLTGPISDPELVDLAADAPLDAAARTLMDTALARGARDNVTLILVDAVPDGLTE